MSYLGRRRRLPGTVHDGVETMRNGEHGAILELAAYGLLNQLVRVVIDGRCGLVQDEDLVLAEESARQTNQLSLSHTFILASLNFE